LLDYFVSKFTMNTPQPQFNTTILELDKQGTNY
jgi:hypothetical protein